MTDPPVYFAPGHAQKIWAWTLQKLLTHKKRYFGSLWPFIICHEEEEEAPPPRVPKTIGLLNEEEFPAIGQANCQFILLEFILLGLIPLPKWQIPASSGKKATNLYGKRGRGTNLSCRNIKDTPTKPNLSMHLVIYILMLLQI